jgi:hypothetical protein
MTLLFYCTQNFNLIATRLVLRTLSAKTVIMAASSSYNVYIPSDTIPTAATKITLANRILISPLGKFQISCILRIVSYIYITVLGTWAWGDKKQWEWNEELDVKAREAFEMSISKGINTFDTAEVYGNGER